MGGPFVGGPLFGAVLAVATVLSCGAVLALTSTSASASDPGSFQPATASEAATDVTPVALAPLEPQAAGSIVFQAARCVSFGDIPGNLLVNPALDDTGGAYLGWGPAAEEPVQPIDVASGPCRPLDGIRFRTSASAAGADLSPRSAGYVPPGSEDGRTTTIVTGRTGDAGPATLRIPLTDVVPAQRFALTAGGLWVSALDVPGRFGNLRCHYDRYNADNLEVLRSTGSATLTCVLYVVMADGAGKGTSDRVGDGAGDGAGNGAAPPSIGAPQPAPSGSATPPVLSAPATPPQADSDLPAPPAPVPVPVPVLAPTPATDRPGVAAVDDPGARGDEVAAAAPEGRVTRGSSGGERAPDADDERAAPGPATLAVRVEVGGVTRGAMPAGAGRVQTAWLVPIRVRYSCGDSPPVVLEVRPDQVPGFVIEGPPVVVRPSDRCTIVALEDGRGLGAALDGSVQIRVGNSVVAPGMETVVRPALGRSEVQRVLFNFGPATPRDRAVDDAPGRDGTAGVAAPATAAAPARAVHRLTPIAGMSLASVFLVGLLLSVLAARRPL